MFVLCFGSFLTTSCQKTLNLFSHCISFWLKMCPYRRFEFLFTVISHVRAPLIWQEVALLRAKIVLALILETLSMCRETAAVHLAT